MEALFPAGLIDEMFAAYAGLLDWLSGDAERWQGPVPDLLPAAQAAIRDQVNATEAARPVQELGDHRVQFRGLLWGLSRSIGGLEDRTRQ